MNFCVIKSVATLFNILFFYLFWGQRNVERKTIGTKVWPRSWPHCIILSFFVNLVQTRKEFVWNEIQWEQLCFNLFRFVWKYGLYLSLTPWNWLKPVWDSDEIELFHCSFWEKTFWHLISSPGNQSKIRFESVACNWVHPAQTPVECKSISEKTTRGMASIRFYITKNDDGDPV